MGRVIGYVCLYVICIALIFSGGYILAAEVYKKNNITINPDTGVEQPGTDIDTDWHEQYNTLYNTYLELQEQKNNLTADLNTLQTTLIEKQNLLNELEGRIDIYIQNDEFSQTTINTLELELETKSIEIRDLQSYIAQLESTISQLNERILELENNELTPTSIKYFTVDSYLGVITGLTEEGKQLTEIVIPTIYSLDTPAIVERDNVPFAECVTFIGAHYLYPVCEEYPFYVREYGTEEYTALTSATQAQEYAYSVDQTKNYDIKYYLKTYCDGTDYWITSIGACAFKDNQNLTSVVIPHGIHSIYESAFEGCTNLTSVVLPDSLETIEDHVFAGCHHLTNMLSIPSRALFEYCSTCKGLGSYNERFACTECEDGHITESMQCRVCLGTGEYCYKCEDGVCTYCNGQGCNYCVHNGVCAACHGDRICGRCTGTGIEEVTSVCVTCHGDSIVNTSTICTDCDGYGKTMKDIRRIFS